jgi:hypothetical protein
LRGSPLTLGWTRWIASCRANIESFFIGPLLDNRYARLRTLRGLEQLFAPTPQGRPPWNRYGTALRDLV